jgi:hypothetical protein
VIARARRLPLLGGVGLVVLLASAQAAWYLPGRNAAYVDPPTPETLAPPARGSEPDPAALPPPVEADSGLVHPFRDDLRRFAADLVATGRVEPMRARRLAYVAVTEAYRYDLPPALVFAVMLAENDRFNPRAVSSMGAIGLMQVDPKAWLRTVGPYFGYDLYDEATNLRSGVYILAYYAARNRGDWVIALRRYNGCVRGTVTPGCLWRYPTTVRDHVERQALNLCPERDFDACVGRPLHQAFAGRR